MRKIFHNGKHLRSGCRLLLFCALIFAFAYSAHLLLRHLPLPEYHGLHPVGVIVDDAVLLLVALAATAIMAHIERRNLVSYGLPRVRELFGRMFWRGTAWGIGMSCSIIVLKFLAGGFHIDGLNLTGLELLKFAILWLIADLLIGFSEEILFRGYFMYTLAEAIGFWMAALLESIGFGALHYYTKPHERGRIGWPSLC